MRPSIVFAALALTACAFDEDHFVRLAPQSYCANYKSCDLDRFLQTWPDGTSQCREQATRTFKHYAYNVGDVRCTFEEDRALHCVEQIGSASCGELFDEAFIPDCAQEAWDCVSLTGL